MSGTKALSGERRVVTAMFCDLVGSTAMAEDMDPEDWSEIVARAVGMMSDAVAHYDGTVTQFAGDGILAIFGSPVAHEDDPYRAVRTALDILTQIGSHAVEVRIGINTGLMVISDMDAGAFRGYAALGDAVNAAARIEGLAPPGSVLIGGATAKLVGSDFDLRDMGEAEVKGKSKPVHVYEVVGARGAPTRGRGLSGLRSELVGRDPELQALRELLEAAAAGRGRFAAVTGEPGIGKSRLVREMSSLVQEIDGACWALGRCLSYGSDLPYHLVASVLRSLARVPDGESDAVAGERVGALAVELFGAEHEADSLLRQLVGAKAGAADTEAQYRHVQYVDILAELVRRWCRQHAPLVLVCEDVHWADESSVELLDTVFERCQDMPLLVVLVSRPDRSADGWRLVTSLRKRLGEAFTQLALKTLAEGDTRQLVANLLEVESLPETLRRQVLEKTDGNPFFVEEVIRMLIDRGMVEHRNGRWVATDSVADIEVPGTVRGLLTARIDLLSPDVRRAGMVAAVIGRRFDAQLFERVCPNEEDPEASIHPHLGRLEAQGFIMLASVRPRLEFAFRHALVHDVMYETLLNRERRELHLQVGEAVEAEHADRRFEVAPILADHFDRADDGGRAQKYLMQAGEHAMARHAVREAHSFFERAYERMRDGGTALAPMRVAAVIGMGQSGYTFVPANRQIAVLEDAQLDLDALGDPNLQAEVNMLHLRLLHDMTSTHGDPKYGALVEQTFALIDQVTNPITAALLKGNMAQVKRFSNDPQSSLPLFVDAVEALESGGWYSQACFQACAATDCTATLGRFTEAEKWLARARRNAERSGDPNAKLDVDLLSGRLAAERGELESAGAHLQNSINAADAYGNTFCELVGNFFAADQRLRAGRPQEALPFLERTHELATYCNAGPLELLSATWMAAAQAALGEDSAADFDRLLATAKQTGSLMAEAQVLARKATAAAGAESPDWEQVALDFERAIECFEQVGALPSAARTLHTYGSALEVAGRTEAGEQALRRAAQLFDELGMANAA